LEPARRKPPNKDVSVELNVGNDVYVSRVPTTEFLAAAPVAAIAVLASLASAKALAAVV
jgi:hypothetical protein